MPFSKSVSVKEDPTDWAEIWIWLNNFIFYADNDNAMHTPLSSFKEYFFTVGIY